MSDTIIVRCATCGKQIGEITFIRGNQKVGCPQCSAQTMVKIYSDGSVDIS